MIREVDLVSYLPAFMADYKEIHTALTAENPEFILVWKAADRVLQNEFIATADEYGISRFEKMLKILPFREDTLESRRARVQSRWFTTLPYTWRMFIQKLIALCGENNFIVTKQFDFYRIDLVMQLELFGQLEELEKLIEAMLPCNMVVGIKNELSYDIEGAVCSTGNITFTEEICIVGDSIEYIDLLQQIFGTSGVIITECINVNNKE